VLIGAGLCANAVVIHVLSDMKQTKCTMRAKNCARPRDLPATMVVVERVIGLLIRVINISQEQEGEFDTPTHTTREICVKTIWASLSEAIIAIANVMCVYCY